MNLNISNKLRQQLAHLGESQLEHLVRQAEHLRSRSGSKSGSLDDWIQRALKKEQRASERALDVTRGTVASVMAREADVEKDVGTYVRCQIGANQLVVGDEVMIGMVGEQPTVIQVLPRRSKLSRTDVQTGVEQLVVANVDVVVIVVSVVAPPLHPRIIDRYLAAIRRGGAGAAVAVNKIDLLEDAGDLEKLAPYEKAGLPVFKCSAEAGDGIAELRQYLASRVVAFVGHSGVGKSSLANAFAPELGLRIGEVSAGYGRGTHTTTTSSLHRLADGTTLIDTPGIRSFGLYDVQEDDIAASFPEFAGHACKFSDCRHVSEPGCGVWDAVRNGGIAEERYWAYRRLIEDK